MQVIFTVATFECTLLKSPSTLRFDAARVLITFEAALEMAASLPLSVELTEDVLCKFSSFTCTVDVASVFNEEFL